MRPQSNSKALALLFIAAIADCVALPAAVFAAIAYFVDTRPALSVHILVMAIVVLFVLTLALLMEQPPQDSGAPRRP